MRCALVGFGGIAERAHLPALSQAGIEVAVVVEPNAARRRVASDCSPGVQLFADLEAGMGAAAAAEVTFVLVCTPPYLHCCAVRAALQAHLHVLCEKPWVLHLADAEELATLALRHDRIIGCVNNWTAAPSIRAAWDLAQVHQLGPIERLQQQTLRTQPAPTVGAWRTDPLRAGGGILLDHGWHALTILLRTFAGRAPDRLAVRMSVAGEPLTASQAEDTVNLEMAYDDGRSASYFASWRAVERRNTLDFYYRHGSIHLDGAKLRVQGKDGALLEEQVFAESLEAGGYRPTWMRGLLQEFLVELDQRPASRRLQRESHQTLALISRAYSLAS